MNCSELQQILYTEAISVAQQINTTDAHFQAGIESAISAGKLLVELQDFLSENQDFPVWLETNFSQTTRSRAYNYMCLSILKDRYQTFYEFDVLSCPFTKTWALFALGRAATPLEIIEKFAPLIKNGDSCTLRDVQNFKSTLEVMTVNTTSLTFSQESNYAVPQLLCKPKLKQYKRVKSATPNETDHLDPAVEALRRRNTDLIEKNRDLCQQRDSLFERVRLLKAQVYELEKLNRDLSKSLEFAQNPPDKSSWLDTVMNPLSTWANLTEIADYIGGPVVVMRGGRRFNPESNEKYNIHTLRVALKKHLGDEVEVETY